MNRNNTRLVIIALFVLAFIAALGAFIALGNNSGDPDSETVTSPPVSDSVDVEADANSTDSGPQDQTAEDLDPDSSDVEELDVDSDDTGALDGEDNGLSGIDEDVDQGDSAPTQSGLSRWCPAVQHVPPPGTEGLFLSAVHVNGEIFSAGYDAIQLQGDTLNNGEPLIIDITGTQFEAPIGINEFGDHEILTLNLVDSSGDNPTLDLLPTLQSGPGAVFPVGPDEGPLFDQECFELPQLDQMEVPPADSGGQEGTSAEEVEEFMALFASAHQRGDAGILFETLHPAVPERFGEQTCREYIDRTVGSIVDARVIGVGEIVPFELDTPQGAVGFPAVIPIDVEFTTPDGNTMVSAAHLPLHNGEVTWLTVCGTD